MTITSEVLIKYECEKITSTIDNITRTDEEYLKENETIEEIILPQKSKN
jgi:hypothetical protein